jgi:hypothetical protein
MLSQQCHCGLYEILRVRNYMGFSKRSFFKSQRSTLDGVEIFKLYGILLKVDSIWLLAGILAQVRCKKGFSTYHIYIYFFFANIYFIIKNQIYRPSFSNAYLNV